MKRLAAVVTACLILAAPAGASGQTVGGSSDRMAEMIDELRALIEKGERERLADPWFLRDLSDVIARYDNPWRVSLYSEEFDRDGAPPDPWQVRRGEMRVDWRFGLRSLVRPPEPSASEQNGGTGAQAPSGEEAAQAILGAILKGVIDQSARNTRTQQDGGTTQQQGQADDTTPALATAQTNLGNAFRIDATLALRGLGDGTAPQAELGVYQEIGGNLAGYRLTYVGADDRLALIRVSSRGGRAVLEIAGDPVQLDEGEDHRVRWSRDPQGRMAVSVNGTEVLTTVDRAFSDPWQGLVLRNTGGDVSLRRISVAGTE
jgi:hypothetical protein